MISRRLSLWKTCSVHPPRTGACVDDAAALDPSAAILHEDMTTNLAATITQSTGDVDAAFTRADVVLRHTFRFGRLSGQPLETRGAVAIYERLAAMRSGNGDCLQRAAVFPNHR